MLAVLTACAVSGFYPHKGHCYRKEVQFADCSAAIERAASDMADAGQVVRFTSCASATTNTARLAQ
jgi:hypothetical protein